MKLKELTIECNDDGVYSKRIRIIKGDFDKSQIIEYDWGKSYTLVNTPNKEALDKLKQCMINRRLCEIKYIQDQIKRIRKLK